MPSILCSAMLIARCKSETGFQSHGHFLELKSLCSSIWLVKVENIFDQRQIFGDLIHFSEIYDETELLVSVLTSKRGEFQGENLSSMMSWDFNS